MSEFCWTPSLIQNEEGRSLPTLEAGAMDRPNQSPWKMDVFWRRGMNTEGKAWGAWREHRVWVPKPEGTPRSVRASQTLSGKTRRGLKTRVRTCSDIQGHRTVKSRMLFPTQEAKKPSRLTQLPAYVEEAGEAAERGGAPNYSRSPPPGYCPHLDTQPWLLQEINATLFGLPFLIRAFLHLSAFYILFSSFASKLY